MIVCSCFRVSDADLRQLVHRGASEDDVVRTTSAGTSCGCCVLQVREVIAAERGGCGKSPPCPGCVGHRAAAA